MSSSRSSPPSDDPVAAPPVEAYQFRLFGQVILPVTLTALAAALAAYAGYWIVRTLLGGGR